MVPKLWTCFCIILTVSGLPMSKAASPTYLYPLSETTGSAEVIYGGAVNDGACGRTAFLSHPTLPYPPIFLQGNELSYLELTVGTQTIIDGDWSFAMFVYSLEPHCGTIFHYVYDSQLPIVGETEDLYADEIKLELNGTHILFSLLGPNKEDYGSAVLGTIFSAEEWIPLLVAHDEDNGVITIETENNKFYKSSDYQDNTEEVLLHQPGKIKLGGSYGEMSSAFAGSIVCFGIYAAKISESNFDNLLDDCQPSNWVVIPFLDSSTHECETDFGYFVLIAKNSKPISSISTLWTQESNSNIQCGHICSITSLCHSFTYNKTTNLCALYAGIYEGMVSVDVGTHYYRNIDACC